MTGVGCVMSYTKHVTKKYFELLKQLSIFLIKHWRFVRKLYTQLGDNTIVHAQHNIYSYPYIYIYSSYHKLFDLFYFLYSEWKIVKEKA